MSVIFLGDGTTTSSIALEYTGTAFKDTRPDTAISSESPNATRVIGDGGFDYVYRRGKMRTGIRLSWTMIPALELRVLQAMWAQVEMHHWFTLQTTDLSRKEQLYNLVTGTTVFPKASLDGTNALSFPGNDWILLGKYIIWTMGINTLKPKRIRNYYSAGELEMEEALTIANGDRFYIGWPVRFTSPLQIEQYGNIRTHYNVSVDCETVVF